MPVKDVRRFATCKLGTLVEGITDSVVLLGCEYGYKHIVARLSAFPRDAIYGDVLDAFVWPGLPLFIDNGLICMFGDYLNDGKFCLRLKLAGARDFSTSHSSKVELPELDGFEVVRARKESKDSESGTTLTLWLKKSGDRLGAIFKTTLSSHTFASTTIVCGTVTPSADDISAYQSHATKKSTLFESEYDEPSWVLEAAIPQDYMPNMAISESGKGMFVHGTTLYEFTASNAVSPLEMLAAIATLKQLSVEQRSAIYKLGQYDFGGFLGVCFDTI